MSILPDADVEGIGVSVSVMFFVGTVWLVVEFGVGELIWKVRQALL